MKNLRTLAILLLDDENGINEAAYNELAASLVAAGGNEDILNAVTAQDGRYFIGPDDAQDLLKASILVPEENYISHETPLGEQIDGGGEID